MGTKKFDKQGLNLNKKCFTNVYSISITTYSIKETVGKFCHLVRFRWKTNDGLLVSVLGNIP